MKKIIEVMTYQEALDEISSTISLPNKIKQVIDDTISHKENGYCQHCELLIKLGLSDKKPFKEFLEE